MPQQKRFSIFVSAAAEKELRKPGPSAAQEILRQVEKKLTVDPVGYGEPLHADLAGYFKLRVSGFRVVCRVVEDRVSVLVPAAGKRDEGNVDHIYDWLTRETLDARTAELLNEVEKEKGSDRND